MKTIDFLVQELPKLGGWPDGAIGAGFLCGEGTLYFWDESNDCPTKWRVDTEAEVEDSASEISREQYEAALAAKNDGWIEWGGGKCPLHNGAIVDVKLRNGRAEYAQKALSTDYASCCFWRNDGAGGDIIAYRPHKPQESEQPEASEADLNECIGQDAAPVWNGEGLPPVGCECEVSVDGGRSWCTYRAINEKNGARLIEIGNFTEEFQNNNWIFRPTRSEAEQKRDEAVKAIMLTGWCQNAAEEIYDLIAAGKVPGMKLED